MGVKPGHGGGYWMHVSRSDAAVIYARACRAWYGKRALKVVTDQIRRLKRRGDADGVAIWTNVADRLSELNAVHKPRRGVMHGKLY
jgi:hypothetical protein